MNTMDVGGVTRQFAETGNLGRGAIETIVAGAGNGSISEELLANFLRTVLQREEDGKPLSFDQAAAYTKAMAYSGLVFNWDELELPVAARHTPGCVGDTQSGPVDAILRACEIASVNFTGKRLMHTPGTLERFSCIPGFNCLLTPAQVRSQMRTLGMVITGQSSEIAPADGRLYALRDKIGAVDCIAHICASVMSKKIASGPKFLSLTVTWGPAAIMPTKEKALRCAAMMRGIGEGLGVRVNGDMFHAYDSISPMLGTGSLGMKSCIRVLRGEAPKDEETVSLRSAAHVILASGKAPTMKDAVAMALQTIREGRALEWFRRLVEAQGGDGRVVDDPDKILGNSAMQKTVLATRTGYVKPDIRTLGALAHELTGAFQASNWYPLGGIHVSRNGRYGSYIRSGETLCVIHAKDVSSAAAIEARVTNAFAIEAERFEVPDRFAPLPSIDEE